MCLTSKCSVQRIPAPSPSPTSYSKENRKTDPEVPADSDTANFARRHVIGEGLAHDRAAPVRSRSHLDATVPRHFIPFPHPSRSMAVCSVGLNTHKGYTASFSPLPSRRQCRGDCALPRTWVCVMLFCPHTFGVPLFLFLCVSVSE